MEGIFFTLNPTIHNPFVGGGWPSILWVEASKIEVIWVLGIYTLPKTNIAPEKLPSQKESSLPSTIFQGLC